MSDDVDDDQAWEIRPLGIVYLSTHNHALAQEIGERLTKFMSRNNLIIVAKEDGLYFDSALPKIELTAKPRV